jgi:hypothetical protein
MGGLGSGRQPTRTSVADCRVIEIGELCDAGRYARCPRGEIRWVDGHTKATRACLSYTIAEQLWPGGETLLTLTLCYRRTETAPQSRDHVVLTGGAGRRIFAACPFCERPVRKLYAPPGAEHFLCRRCHDLVYRRVPQQESLAALAEVQAAMGWLLEGLYGLPDGGGPGVLKRSTRVLLSTLQEELPLEPQELRTYCLRLAKAGLSVRQIAALVGSSKSSVGRYLAAGLAGLDREVLIAERLRRYWAVAELSPVTGLRALRQQMKVLERRARRYRRYSALRGEPEERVFIAQNAADEVGAAGEESI